jgi:hypothetical protein
MLPLIRTIAGDDTALLDATIAPLVTHSVVVIVHGYPRPKVAATSTQLVKWTTNTSFITDATLKAHCPLRHSVCSLWIRLHYTQLSIRHSAIQRVFCQTMVPTVGVNPACRRYTRSVLQYHTRLVRL